MTSASFAAARFDPLHRWTGNERTRAFDSVFLSHLEGAQQLARDLTRDPEDCEKAMVEALSCAFRNLENFRGSSPRAWLLANVRRACHAVEAGRGGSVALIMREAALPGATGLLPKGPGRPKARKATPFIKGDVHCAASVRLVIDAIPEPFREAIVLRDLQQLSAAEIAEVTGLPVSAVIARLALANLLLDEELRALGSARPHGAAA